MAWPFQDHQSCHVRWPLITFNRLAIGASTTLFACCCSAAMPQRAGLDMHMGLRVADARKSAVYEMCLSFGAVKKLCDQGQLIEAVEALGVLVRRDSAVSQSLFYSVLKKCVVYKDLGLGRRVHALAVKAGYETDTFLCNHIVRMYASHARLQEAMDVFTRVAQPDAFMWSSIITAHVNRGQAKQGVELYHWMRESGVKPDGHVFVAALQACARGADLETGQQLHADVLASDVERDAFICNSLLDMYAKCGSLDDARRLFDGLAQKTVVMWTTLIAGYAQQGMGCEALRLYEAMQEEGMPASPVTFVCLLQACAGVGTPAMEQGKQLHAQIIERGFEGDVFVANGLIDMYAKCGSLEDAQGVFDGLGERNVVTWNAMIGGYSQQGMGQVALDLYRSMQEEGKIAPDAVTFMCLLQACAGVGTPALETGKQFHTQIRELGLQAHVFVANSLVDMYAKCGSVEVARDVFNGLSEKTVVTWNAMMGGYVQQGMGQKALDLYSLMQEEGMIAPNPVTFVCLLQSCANVGAPALETGKQLHARIGEQTLQSDVFVANSLVDMYAKCGGIEDARGVFDRLGHTNVVMWTTLISGYSQRGMGEEALHLYRAMQEEGLVAPNSVTFACLLQACASEGSLSFEKGKQLHAEITEQGLLADVFVANSLINMYTKCGSLDDAHGVFDRLDQKNVVTWNVMIGGYSHQGMGQEALRLYRAMQEEGICAPDYVTFACILQACSSVGSQALEKGKQLHAQIRERGLQADVVVGGSLVNMYAKCGSLKDAEIVFDGLAEKNVVTWTSLIAGYSQQGMGHEALRLYRAMGAEGMVPPDSVTFVCLLHACASVAALHVGRQLHAQIKVKGLQDDVTVGNSLINMYAKSGSMVDAQEVFDALPERDIMTWSSLVAGYTSKGDSEQVFDLVLKMEEDGIQPDGVTFLSVLTVCSHTGLVNEGQYHFEAMNKQYGINPTVEHYTCIVDLLGRAGRLAESLALVQAMPVPPNAAVWHTLLGACQKCSNVEVGLHAFAEAIKLDKRDAAAYVLMSNIYTGAQMWEQAQEMQERRAEIGAWKEPGQSWWIDMDGILHSFLVANKEHPERSHVLTSFTSMSTVHG